MTCLCPAGRLLRSPIVVLAATPQRVLSSALRGIQFMPDFRAFRVLSRLPWSKPFPWFLFHRLAHSSRQRSRMAAWYAPLLPR